MFLAGKVSATKFPPEEIDLVLNYVVIELYNQYYDHYVKTQKISDYMIPFKREKLITLDDNGLATLPGDYEHVRAVGTESGLPVEVLEDINWYQIINSAVGSPSGDNFICRIVNPEAVTIVTKIEVKPITDKILFSYFIGPVVASYAYTISGSRYVYDDANSVDIQFGRSLLPEIIKRVASGLGMNLRDQQLVQYFELQKSQDQIK
jgi:hypothetical protein